MTAASPERLDEIKERLTEPGVLEDLALAEMGPPNKGTLRAKEWRWGKKGSAALVMRGPKRGAFYTHEGAAGGSTFDFVMWARSCSFKDAVGIAKRRLGIDDDAPLRPEDDATRREREARRARERAQREAEEAREIGRRIAKARRFVDHSMPVEPGSVGDHYLTVVRCIPRPDGGWPADVIRWYHQEHALVCIATRDDGTVQAVQLIYLTPEGEKIGAEEVERRRLQSNKMTYGPLEGAAMRLPGEGEPIDAEGPESGLSVWRATARPVLVGFGSVANLDPPGPVFTIAADDDNRFHPSQKQLRRRVAEWMTAGYRVSIVYPWRTRRQDKSDFNDVLRQGGSLDAIRARFTPPPPDGGPDGGRIVVREARLLLDRYIGEFVRQAAAFDADMAEAEGKAPPVHVIRADVGAGKSDITRRAVASDYLARAHADAIDGIAKLREQQDRRSVVIFVPTRKLGAEQLRELNEMPEARALGIRAAQWLGREAPNPAAPDEKMCLDLDAVEDALKAGAGSVRTAVCLRKDEDGTEYRCPFASVCGYLAQEATTADIWILSHDMLHHPIPKALGEVAFIVVDESMWRRALDGVDGRHRTIALDTLDTVDEVPGDPGKTERLTRLRRRLATIVRGMTDGPLLRTALDTITAGEAGDAKRLEWNRKREPDIRPGMSAAERKEAVHAAVANLMVRRMAAMWGAVADLLAPDGPEASGWLSLDTENTKHGPVRVLRIKGRRRIAKEWARLPALLIDANANLDLIRPWWPQARMIADIRIGTSHQVIRQVGDYSFSLEALANPYKLRELRAILCRFGRNYYPGRVLAVVQLEVEAALRALGNLPRNLELAHHNAVAGRDEWGPKRDRKTGALIDPGIRALVVVGRTQAPPCAVETLNEALTGRAVVPLGGWYERVAVPRQMADRTVMMAEADRHPDPAAEAIRWQICEGELVQIIGRGRGVNRTIHNPLDVWILTDVPLPLPVDEIITAAALAPSLDDMMLAEGGIVFANGTHAGRAYPGLWNTQAASRQAILRAGRARSATIPKESVLFGECRRPLQATYRLAGAGQRPWTIGYEPELVPDLRAALEGWLGALAELHIEDSPEPEPPSPEPPRPAPRPSAEPTAPADPTPAPPAPLAPPLDGPPAGNQERPASCRGQDSAALPNETGRPPLVAHPQGGASPPIGWGVEPRRPDISANGGFL